MKKLISAAILTALFVVSLAAIVNAASDSGKATAKPISNRLEGVNKSLLRVRCGTVSCINGNLTRLTKAVKAIINDLNNCEQTVNITQYTEYEKYLDQGPINGIRFTDPGGAASHRMLVYVC